MFEKADTSAIRKRLEETYGYKWKDNRKEHVPGESWPAATSEELDAEAERLGLAGYNVKRGVSDKSTDKTIYACAPDEWVIQARLASTGIPPEHKDCTLENFSCPHDGYQMILSDVCDWIEVLGLDSAARHSLLITGTTGVGKTHLACGLIRRFAAKTRKARFVSYLTLLAEFRKGYDGEDADHFIENIDVLLIDDFLVEDASQSVLDRVKYILFERISHQKTTILTTNLQFPTGLEKPLGDRLISRLRQHYQKIAIPLPDWRKVTNGG